MGLNTIHSTDDTSMSIFSYQTVVCRSCDISIMTFFIKYFYVESLPGQINKFPIFKYLRMNMQEGGRKLTNSLLVLVLLLLLHMDIVSI